MQKFENMKNEITESGKKFKAYHEEIENRKLRIELLEAEIENTKLGARRSAKVEEEIKGDKDRMKKQIETLNSLKEALSFKIAATKK
jgi:chaperonin cofactor prefoldin